jgi:predicted membrane GTPase involved in stress response
VHALGNLEPRGVLFVDATAEVYEGMLVGEHSRWAGTAGLLLVPYCNSQYC